MEYPKDMHPLPGVGELKSICPNCAQPQWEIFLSGTLSRFFNKYIITETFCWVSFFDLIYMICIIIWR